MGLFDKVLDTVKVVAEPFKAVSPIVPFASAALSYFGGRQQNVASAQAAQKQMDFQREASDTSFQRQVQDLKAAGINPMLVSRLGGASTPGGSMPQFVNPFAQAGQAYSAAQQAGASTLDAETRSFLSEAQYKQIDAAADKLKEEIKNVPLEGERLQQTATMLLELGKLYMQQGNTAAATEAMVRETVKKLKSETTLLDFSIDAIRNFDNLGKNVEQLKPILDLIKPLITR